MLMILRTLVPKDFELFLNCKPLKLNLKVFLASHTVAMATYCVTKLMTTCSPMIEEFVDTIIEASSDEEWL